MVIFEKDWEFCMNILLSAGTRGHELSAKLDAKVIIFNNKKLNQNLEAYIIRDPLFMALQNPSRRKMIAIK